MEVFLPIIDTLVSELEKRMKAYDGVTSKFGYLSKIPSVNDAELRDAVKNW